MRRPLLLILWLFTDLWLFTGAYVLAYFLRVGFIVSTDFPLRLFVQSVSLVAPVFVGIMAMLGVFRLMRTQSHYRNLMHILFSCIIASALFTLSYYFLHDRFFSRLLLIYAFVLSTGITIVWHLGFERAMRHTLRMGRPVYPTLIIGATREAGRMIAMLNAQKSPLTPVAILDGRGTKESTIAGVPVEGKLNKLEETIKKYNITHLMQASDLEQSMNLLSACRNHGINYLLLPSVLGMIEGDERIELIEGQPVTTVRTKKQWLGWFFG